MASPFHKDEVLVLDPQRTNATDREARLLQEGLEQEGLESGVELLVERRCNRKFFHKLVFTRVTPAGAIR